MTAKISVAFNYAVELIALTKRYSQGKPVVVSIKLRIACGSFYRLLGRSFCGINSTLCLDAGHESAGSGDSLLEDHNVTIKDAAVRATAMLFQSSTLFPHLTDMKNSSFSLRMKMRDPREVVVRMREYLPWLLAQLQFNVPEELRLI